MRALPGFSVTVTSMSSNHLDARFFIPDSGMVSVTETGKPVVIFPGQLQRAEASDRTYMVLVAALGMEKTDQRLRGAAIGGDTPLSEMLLAPLYIRMSHMWGIDIGDGFYLDDNFGDFAITAVNLDGLVTAECSDDGESVILL